MYADTKRISPEVTVQLTQKLSSGSRLEVEMRNYQDVTTLLEYHSLLRK